MKGEHEEKINNLLMIIQQLEDTQPLEDVQIQLQKE